MASSATKRKHEETVPKEECDLRKLNFHYDVFKDMNVLNHHTLKCIAHRVSVMRENHQTLFHLRGEAFAKVARRREVQRESADKYTVTLNKAHDRVIDIVAGALDDPEFWVQYSVENSTAPIPCFIPDDKGDINYWIGFPMLMAWIVYAGPIEAGRIATDAVYLKHLIRLSYSMLSSFQHALLVRCALILNPDLGANQGRTRILYTPAYRDVRVLVSAQQAYRHSVPRVLCDSLLHGRLEDVLECCQVPNQLLFGMALSNAVHRTQPTQYSITRQLCILVCMAFDELPPSHAAPTHPLRVHLPGWAFSERNKELARQILDCIYFYAYSWVTSMSRLQADLTMTYFQGDGEHMAKVPLKVKCLKMLEDYTMTRYFKERTEDPCRALFDRCIHVGVPRNVAVPHPPLKEEDWWGDPDVLGNEHLLRIVVSYLMPQHRIANVTPAFVPSDYKYTTLDMLEPIKHNSWHMTLEEDVRATYHVPWTFEEYLGERDEEAYGHPSATKMARLLR